MQSDFVRPAGEASRTSCPTLPVPKFQLRPSLELWNVSNGTNQRQNFIGSHAADSRQSKRYFNALPSSFTLIDGKMV
jgi:hypothetical protein